MTILLATLSAAVGGACLASWYWIRRRRQERVILKLTPEEEAKVAAVERAELRRLWVREGTAGDTTEAEVARLRAALRRFAGPGGPDDVAMPAYQDLDDDVVVWENSGAVVTAGDVRHARALLGSVTDAEAPPDVTP